MRVICEINMSSEFENLPLPQLASRHPGSEHRINLKKTDCPYSVKTEGSLEPIHAELKWDFYIATERNEEHPFSDKLHCLALVSTGLCQYQDKQKGTNMKAKEGQKKNKG